ncbi:MAG: hypothetical protein KGL15_11725 [Acidobacteriota bacterium]|nr:hypothetical protein [Acidobacteriota bacterium]
MPDLSLGPTRARPAGGPGALELLTVGRISVDLYGGQACAVEQQLAGSAR